MFKCILVYLTLTLASAANADALDELSDDVLREVVQRVLVLTRNACDSRGYINVPKSDARFKMEQEYWDALPEEKQTDELLARINESTLKYFCFTTEGSMEI